MPKVVVVRVPAWVKETLMAQSQLTFAKDFGGKAREPSLVSGRPAVARLKPIFLI
jgi:hypothetical protein